MNGAAQGIKLLPQVLGVDRMATFVPAFDEYLASFPKVLGVDADQHSLLDSVRLVVENQIPAVLVVNPNNPTGRCYSGGEITLFLQAAEQSGLISILDESFIDFAGSEAGSIANDMTTGMFQNVILVKSLSKCLGVPGLRLGCVLSASLRLIRELNRLLPIWNTNSVAQYFLELLLKCRPEIAASFKRTIEGRQAFFSDLFELSFLEPRPSGGNFVLCRLKDERFTAETLARRLMRSNPICIKECTRKFEAGRGELVRFAIRTPAENSRLIDALKEAYASPVQV